MNNMKTRTLFFTALTLFTINTSLAIENNHEHAVLLDKVHQSERDDRQYEVIELDNKMRVLLVSDPKATITRLLAVIVPHFSLKLKMG